MKFSTFLAIASALLAPAHGLSILRDDDQTILGDDDRHVPGDSPIHFCDKPRDDDLLDIESVDLLPNPPQAGHELIIKAVGTIKKTIEDGAYILLTVKYGLIRLISTKADLCEQVKNVDLECPLEKGVLTITKTVSLPGEIPPGKYTVLADVFTKDDEQITCLTATVVFGRQSILGLEL